ncbi:MAG: flagellin [Burkholderiales bacterium]
MPSVINTNLLSLTAQRNAGASQGALATSIQRLSSGLRINSARDDAAGLGIAVRMDSQARGMDMGIRNANDGISLAQTGEGALGKVSDMLQRMRELSVQSANASNTTVDRTSLDNEFQQLTAEITRTLSATKFNGTAILGANAGAQTFQVGADNSTTDQISVTTTDMTANASIAAVTGATSAITTAALSLTAISNIDGALATVNSERTKYGAMQNRFDAIISNLQIGTENQKAAKSRIMDADFATETAALTRSQIMQQAATAMIAQANATPQSVLSLLRQ